MNLCGFVGNDGVNWWDVLGLVDEWRIQVSDYTPKSTSPTAHGQGQHAMGAFVKGHVDLAAPPYERPKNLASSKQLYSNEDDIHLVFVVHAQRQFGMSSWPAGATSPINLHTNNLTKNGTGEHLTRSLIFTFKITVDSNTGAIAFSEVRNGAWHVAGSDTRNGGAPGLAGQVVYRKAANDRRIDFRLTGLTGWDSQRIVNFSGDGLFDVSSTTVPNFNFSFTHGKPNPTDDMGSPLSIHSAVRAVCIPDKSAE